MRGKRSLKGEQTKTVRVPVYLIEAVDEIATAERKSRADMASILLEEGIRGRELETAVSQLERGE